MSQSESFKPNERYVVIVHDPPPKAPRDIGVSYQTSARSGPTIWRGRADNPQHAASLAGVAPGAKAEVFREQDMRVYARPEQAPLEQRDARGNPLPTVEAA